MRGVANGDAIGDFAVDDFELGLALAAVETGTVNRSAAILIQAGFTSRLAAIKAVTDTGANLATLGELQAWLGSDVVQAFDQLGDWLTAETKVLWSEFVAGFVPVEKRTWSERRYWAWVQWHEGLLPVAGTALRLKVLSGQRLVMAADGSVMGNLQAVLNPNHRGLLRAQVSAEADKVDITYFGPDDPWLA